MKKSFVYKKIDLTDELPFIKHLDDHAQAYIESCIVDVIYESFIITGDQDYATARLLGQKGLSRAFFWAASQAIEKYLKALIILHGVSVKDKKFKGHPIKKLYEEAIKYEPTISTINLTPHSRLDILKVIKSHVESFTLEKFINDMESNGTPDNRYNSSGTHFNIGHLFALDNFCHFVRSKIEFPAIYDSFRKINRDIIDIFEKHNLWFIDTTKDLLSKSLDNDIITTTSIEVTKLDFLTVNIGNPHNRHALSWLDKKMRLPRAAIEKLQTP